MWTALGLIGGFCFLIWVILAIACKKVEAQTKLKMLKEEVERTANEQKRANEIIDRVRNLPTDTIRRRVQNLSSK